MSRLLYGEYPCGTVEDMVVGTEASDNASHGTNERLGWDQHTVHWYITRKASKLCVRAISYPSQPLSHFLTRPDAILVTSRDRTSNTPIKYFLVRCTRRLRGSPRLLLITPYASLKHSQGHFSSHWCHFHSDGYVIRKMRDNYRPTFCVRTTFFFCVWHWVNNRSYHSLFAHLLFHFQVPPIILHGRSTYCYRTFFWCLREYMRTRRCGESVILNRRIYNKYIIKKNTLQLWDRILCRNSSLQAVCDTPIARITGCVSSLRI